VINRLQIHSRLDGVVENTVSPATCSFTSAVLKNQLKSWFLKIKQLITQMLSMTKRQKSLLNTSHIGKV
jgi:hypothetical protein